MQYLKPAPMIHVRQSIFTCPWANSFTFSPVGNSSGNLDCCWLLPGTTWSYNLRMKEKTAGFLKAKEKAIKSKGQNLNHASSFLTVQGWGQGLVLGNLTEQPQFLERQNLMLSPSRSSARKSAEFVALIWLYSLENPSTYPSAWLKMAPKIRSLISAIYLHTTFLCITFLPLLPLIYYYGCLRRGWVWMQERMGCKPHPLVVVVVVVVEHNADVLLHNVWDGYDCTICSAVCATHCLTNPSAGHL